MGKGKYIVKIIAMEDRIWFQQTAVSNRQGMVFH
jgi:hypothetical protein